MSEDATSRQLFTDRSFNELELPAELRQAVADHGWSRLTRVQDEVLPLSLAGRDVVAQAQTGSGKTATYLLTIFAHLLREPRRGAEGDPRALIVAPTRELAVQISQDAEGLAAGLDFGVHVVFGGIDYKEQREILRRGTDLLIGTPGRLIDYHKQRAYNLKDTEILVVDECDRLFDMGFAEDIHWIIRRLPRPKDRQSMMFTATLSYRVMRLGWQHMNDPAEIMIDPGNITPETISQELYHVASREKLSLLLGLLEREGASRTMIFVNTRYEAQRLVERLQQHGFAARGLTGNVVQRKRLRVLDDFKDGRLPILVATDVASRGLHIEGVSHVINYDLPQDAEDYVHRIGRTARVGAEGKAISLACENYVFSLDAIHKYVGYEIPTAFASDELYKPVKPRQRRPRGEGGGPRESSRGRSERRRPAGESQARTDIKPTAAPPSEAAGAPPEEGERPKRRRRNRGRGGGSKTES